MFSSSGSKVAGLPALQYALEALRHQCHQAPGRGARRPRFTAGTAGASRSAGDRSDRPVEATWLTTPPFP